MSPSSLPLLSFHHFAVPLLDPFLSSNVHSPSLVPHPWSLVLPLPPSPPPSLFLPYLPLMHSCSSWPTSSLWFPKITKSTGVSFNIWIIPRSLSREESKYGAKKSPEEKLVEPTSDRKSWESLLPLLLSSLASFLSLLPSRASFTSLTSLTSQTSLTSLTSLTSPTYLTSLTSLTSLTC
jgi:hypothetical protein